MYKGRVSDPVMAHDTSYIEEASSYTYLQQKARQIDLQKLAQQVTRQGLGDWCQDLAAHPCLPD